MELSCLLCEQALDTNDKTNLAWNANKDESTGALHQVCAIILLYSILEHSDMPHDFKTKILNFARHVKANHVENVRYLSEN